MWFRKDYIIRNVWIVLLFLYENFNVFLFHPDNYHGNDFCQVFLWKVYGSGIVDREHTQTMVIISGLLFVVVCNFLYANFFYKDLHVSSIYIFTRNNNRFKWLINRSLELAVYVFISVSIYVGAAGNEKTFVAALSMDPMRITYRWMKNTGDLLYAEPKE